MPISWPQFDTAETPMYTQSQAVKQGNFRDKERDVDPVTVT